MMKTIHYLITIILLFGTIIIHSCGKDGFLKKPARGTLSSDQLKTPKGIQSLLVGAYSALNEMGMDNLSDNFKGPDNYEYGSIRGGDAHIGGRPSAGGLGMYSASPEEIRFSSKWNVLFEGVKRTNNILQILPETKGLSDPEIKNILGQARFLRGHFYFELKKIFNNVPWIDEYTEDIIQPNDADIWPNITEDFRFAFENLPQEQSEVARANKWAAACYLAKCYMYRHMYPEAKILYDDILSKGKTAIGIPYDLFPRFRQNWEPENELLSPEAVFPIEMATNTVGSKQARAFDRFNYPTNLFQTSGWFQPSMDLVNSFRTDSDGLPYIYEYNLHAIVNDNGLKDEDPFNPDSGNIDPRLDWTVGRRGIPYLDYGLMTGYSWVSGNQYYGPYVNKKSLFWKKDMGIFSDNQLGTGSAVNVILIQFSDVLLSAAEAYAHTGDLDRAENLVNRIRQRAANPQGFVYEYLNISDPEAGFSNVPAANYKIGSYPAGTFQGIGLDKSLDAIYFERKLELAMDGHRFFDLLRWGIAGKVLNEYINFSKSYVAEMNGARFIEPDNFYLPIPQLQIDLTRVNGQPTLNQNPGYR